MTATTQRPLNSIPASSRAPPAHLLVVGGQLLHSAHLRVELAAQALHQRRQCRGRLSRVALHGRVKLLHLGARVLKVQSGAAEKREIYLQ
jgi:hypothetical protein